jgi:hypothetical protein
MKPKSRSRVTNSPASNRGDRSKKATTRRVRDLYTAFLARLGAGPHDEITQAGALRWAELTAICEVLRARALAGENIDSNSITRLESTAARAERALVKGAEAAASDSDPYLEFLRQQEEEDAEAEKSRQQQAERDQ